MANITIVGSGVVGSATGRGFARHGHAVSFVDIDSRRIDELRREGFAASDELRLVGESSFVFLSLPTPNDGPRWDLGPFVGGTRAVAEAVRDSDAIHTVVVRSTVPPGTTDGVVTRILEETTGGKSGERFTVASNPEFLRASCALEDFLHPWMTVFGSRSKRTNERLMELFRPFDGEIHRFEDPRIPEMIKAAHNLFNATKISFWNEMWRVGRRLGIDVRDVATVVSRSAEASINPEYGIHAGEPYGGACLPKDTKGFIGFARQEGVDLPLLEAVDEVNEQIARMARGTFDGDGDGSGTFDGDGDGTFDGDGDGSGRIDALVEMSGDGRAA
ncbi:MAG TPA: 2-dehydropantoate 2-reductase N-terminal domain-containing protein [Actinomycetota bacterium]